MVYVAAQMRQANSTLTLDTYAHLYAEADPAPWVEMVHAIRAARRDVPAQFPQEAETRFREIEESRVVDEHGAYRDRTGDPQLAKLVLSQLS